ncbi:MAG: AsmA family protein [Desulfovibrio sp.]|nr:AsmA family protein [Desulfovibrio sp.]
MPAESRKLRVLLYAGAVLLLAAPLALIPAFFYLRHNSGAIVQAYIDKLAREAGLSIRLPRVDVTFWPMPALVAGDFSLESDDWHFSAEEIRLRPDLAAILRGSFVPDFLEVTHPVLRAGKFAVVPPGIGALFSSGPDNGAVEPDNIKLTVKSGEVFVVENTVASLLFSGVNLTADMTKAGDGRRRCGIQMEGGFHRDGISLPFFLGGTAFLYNSGGQAHHSLRQVEMKDVAFRLDNDAAGFDAVLTLPGRAPEVASRPAASGTGVRIVVVPSPALSGKDAGADAQYPSVSGNSFRLAGRIQVRRVSLTRWLGFGRILPPGLQWALDDVTDAVLDFSLDEKGLDVPSIVAHAAGARFTGSGKVKSWAEPEVALDLKAERLELLAALPEAAGRMPPSPPFPHGPLTPVPGTPLKPGETGLGYDIRLGARFLGYGPLVFEDANVVIREGKLDENGLEDTLLTATAGLYGGNVQGQAVFGGGAQHPYAISAHFRDVKGEELARSLDVLPVQSGHMHADVSVKSQGRALAEFLEKLTGKVEVGVSQGALRPLPSGKRIGKISLEQNQRRAKPVDFNSLALGLAITGSSVFEKEKSRLGLNGQWFSVLNRAGYSLRTDITGMVYFGEDAPLFFQNRPGVLTLQSASTNAQRSLAELRGDFSCLSDKGQVSVSNGHFSSPGIEADGDVRFFEDGERLAYTGTISARLRDAARVSEFAGKGGMRFLSGLRALSLAADVKGNMQEISLNNLHAVTDATQVRGSFSAAFHNQLSLEFNLAVEEFSFDGFFQESGTTSKNAGKPWDLSALRDVRAKGTLRVGRLRLWHFLLQDINIPMVLDNGRLTAAPMTARVYDGTLSGKSILEFARGLRFESDFSVEGAILGAASRDIGTGVVLGGKMDFTLNLAGLSTGVGPVSQSLNGSWRFAVRNGFYQKLDKNGEPRGKATSFDTAQASGDIRAGVARGNDFFLRGNDLVMRGGGFADFNNEILNCDFVVSMKNLPDIPVRLHGNFRDSKTTVSVGKVILNTLGGISKGIFDMLGDVVQGAWKLVR